MALTAVQYMKMAYTEAMKSPDFSTQNGAVLVFTSGVIVSDCNRFPDKVKLTHERQKCPLKYAFTEHAERNVIYKAAKLGVACHGATMYVPWFACADCARAIIQAGIYKVIGHQRMMDETPDHWKDSIAHAMEMFHEAGTILEFIKEELGCQKILFNGKWWQP